MQVKVEPQRRRRAGHLPQRQRHRGDGARAGRRVDQERAAAGVRRVPDHARVGPAARARRAGRTWACARSRPRTRSRRRRWRWARRSAARWASRARRGPGLDLKTETIGLAVMLELPMVIIDVQRAGPVDRHADQDRAVRSAAGAVRAPRRVAAAGARGLLARAVLRRGLRGGADRGHLPHAGDPAERPLRRQLERAVADPVGGRPAADRPALPHDAARRRRRSSLRARRQPGAAVGDPRHARARSTGSAGWRSRTARGAISYDGAEPRAHDRAARGEGGGHRGARPRGPRRGGRRPARARLGLVATGRSARARGACASAAGGSPRRTCTTCNPMPANTRRGAALVRARARAGDEHAASSRTSCAPTLPGRRRVVRARSRASRCCRRRWSRRYGSD